jgi:hypothetical protein
MGYPVACVIALAIVCATIITLALARPGGVHAVVCANAFTFGVDLDPSPPRP